MALITQTELEERLERSLTTDEASAFTLINDTIQAHIERVIIGSSVESAAATTRYYDGGFQHLAIDPCTSITAVIYVDDDTETEYTFDSSDYNPIPRNQTLKTMIRFRAGKATVGMSNIGVTAKFSIYEDTDILNIVKDAILSSLENEITNTSNIKRESIEGYSIEYMGSQTKDALNKLKEIFPVV